MTSAKEIVDTQQPLILSVDVVSSTNEDGGNYDTIPPSNSPNNYGIGSGSDYNTKSNKSIIGTIGQNLYIQIIATDELSGVKGVYAEILKPSGIEEIIDIPVTENNPNLWEITIPFNDPNQDVGLWNIKKIRVQDNSDNINERITEIEFIILPNNYKLYTDKVTKTTDTHKFIKVNFSKEMDVNSINKNSIAIIERSFVDNFNYHKYRKLNDDEVEITLGNDQKTVYIRRNLVDKDEYYKYYYLIIYDSVRDLEGNQLANPMFFDISKSIQ